MVKWLRLLFLLFFTSVMLYAQYPNDPFQFPQENFGKYNTNGIAWGDYDNDGYVDVYLTNGLQAGNTLYHWENLLYRNLGNGSFDSVSTAGPIVTDKYLSGGCSWGDYNNDGFLDMLVAEPHTRTVNIFYNYSKNSLYENNGDGTFISASAPPLTTEDDVTSRIAAAWADYDNNGWIDALVSQSTFQAAADNFALYANSSGSFSSVSNNLTAGTSNRASFNWADFDADGDMDVATLSGATSQEVDLWINTGSDFTKTVLIDNGPDGVDARTGSWGDYDNDGDLDYFVGVRVDDNSNPLPNRLYRNDNGVLTEVTSGVGDLLSDVESTTITAWGDYDNDGDLDLFVGNDGGYPDGHRSYLYENNGNGVFTAVQTILADSSSFARSGAWCDFDNDGDLDFLLGREGPNRFFINNGNSNHFMSVRCVGDGITSNKAAIGALVYLNATINGNTYTQVRDVSSQTGSGSQNDLRAHFGLGDATYIHSLQVKWPAGTTTSYTDLPADKFMVYQQGDLNVTATVIANQNFMYLFGNTGAAVEFTSNTDTDGGDLTVVRYNTEAPNSQFTGASAIAPDGNPTTPNVVAPDRYWAITESGLTGNFTVTVYFDISGMPGISNPQRLVIVKRATSSDPWEPLNTYRIGNTLYASGVTAFSEFSIASNSSDNSLPVELTSFAALALDGAVKLTWTTQSEINNQGFVLERAVDAEGPFQEIASYLTDSRLLGQGNSNRPVDYEYLDEAVVNGITYFYRLIDVDINGKRTVQGIVNATPQAIVSEYRLYPAYPNPFNPETNIKFEVPAIENGNQMIEIVVYDNLGKAVRTLYQGTAQPGVHTLIWDGKNDQGIIQSSGFYFVRMQAGSFNQTQKLLFMK